MIAAYMAAFLSCYPHKSIDVREKRMKDGSVMHRVLINGEGGDILLSEDDLRYATRLFKRGK